MSTERENDSDADEWSLLAPSYEDVLRPRFEGLYNCIANVVVHHIQSNTNKTDKFKILDYGTGPGEPILTILKMLETNQIFNVELQATDSSNKMIVVAKDRLNKLTKQHLTVQFDHFSNSNSYDIITMSLVLPYSSDKTQTLREFFNQINPNGLLISSHWPHPNQVPFLAVIKGVNNYMAGGEQFDVSQYESDISYSCWQEPITQQWFKDAGFTIKEWIVVNLPMYFPNMRSLLGFCRLCSWFNDETLYNKAEQEAKNILHKNYQVEFNPDGSFQLANNGVVVVASK